MFPFITCTWNPIVGCPHNCRYCWAKSYAERLKLYGESFLVSQFFPDRLLQRFNHDDYVFVSDMGDAWAKTVPYEWQLKLNCNIEKSPKATFLFQTKNPNGYVKFYHKHGLFPDNCLLGVTLETNRSTAEWSFAPKPVTRVKNLRILPQRTFVSIEPIMDFDLLPFYRQIQSLEPEMIAVGYDNYHHHLPEPSLDKTMKLIDKLEQVGFKVYRKTLRKGWNEND
jgi:DNA repair photolyase